MEFACNPSSPQPSQKHRFTVCKCPLALHTIIPPYNSIFQTLLKSCEIDLYRPLHQCTINSVSVLLISALQLQSHVPYLHHVHLTSHPQSSNQLKLDGPPHQYTQNSLSPIISCSVRVTDPYLYNMHPTSHSLFLLLN